MEPEFSVEEIEDVEGESESSFEPEEKKPLEAGRCAKKTTKQEVEKEKSTKVQKSKSKSKKEKKKSEKKSKNLKRAKPNSTNDIEILHVSFLK